MSEGVLILNCPVCKLDGKREPQVSSSTYGGILYIILYSLDPVLSYKQPHIINNIINIYLVYKVITTITVLPVMSVVVVRLAAREL